MVLYGFEIDEHEYDEDELSEKFDEIPWKERQHFKCGIGTHCHDSAPYPYFYVFEKTTFRGDFDKLLPLEEISKEMTDTAKSVANRIGLEWKDPDWYVAVYSDH